MCGRVRAIVLGAIVLVVVGCSGGGDTHPSSIGDDPPLPSVDDAAAQTKDGAGDGAAECVSFESRECVIDLGIVNGVHNCTKGIQVCENGQWMACVQPAL